MTNGYMSIFRRVSQRLLMCGGTQPTRSGREDLEVLEASITSRGRDSIVKRLLEALSGMQTLTNSSSTDKQLARTTKSETTHRGTVDQNHIRKTLDDELSGEVLTTTTVFVETEAEVLDASVAIVMLADIQITGGSAAEIGTVMSGGMTEARIARDIGEIGIEAEIDIGVMIEARTVDVAAKIPFLG